MSNTNNPIEEPSVTRMKQAVLSRIESGQVMMRPKWHFILKTIVFATGTIFTGLALLYVVSLIVFVLQRTGVWFAPGFGFRGLGIFLFSAPWLLVLVGFVCAVGLELLTRYYSFSYRKPILYSIGGVVLFVIVGSVVFAQFGVQHAIARFAKDRGIPIARPFYQGFDEQRMKNVHPGTVVSVFDGGFTLESRRRELLTVVIDTETRFPFGVDFVTGDQVVVLGDREDTTIQAFGVRRMDDIPRPERKGGGFRMGIPIPPAQ